MITVTAASRTATSATFRAYQVTGTKRVLVFGPWTARVGTRGIGFFFVVKPNPGVTYPCDYAAVISYNTARKAGLGSAIFLHAGTGGPTAGCVSLPEPELLKVLRWLRQGDHPAITISAR